MTTDQARAILKLVLAGFPTQRQKMSKDDIQAMTILWEGVLADVEYERAQEATIRLLRTATFLPAVAEVRQACVRIARGRVRTGVEGWGEVVKFMRSKGSWKAPGVDFSFEDPITAAVVEAMGWRNLCAGDHKAHVADRAHFIKAYDGIARDQRIEAMAGDGLGLRELSAGEDDEPNELEPGEDDDSDSAPGGDE